jgi:hypothetical protein
MTNDCDRYLEDPETHAAHAETCESCGALSEALDLGDVDLDVPSRPMTLDALPMAAWEGASHRTWPLVIAGVVAAAILAVVFWTATGVSPVATMSSTVPPLDALMKMLQLTGKGLGGPAVAVLFVVINSILFLLLRRAPKGIDV